MESSTENNEDSSLCGLRDINLFNKKYCKQIGIFKDRLGITEEHNSSEEIQGGVDDGNMIINFLFCINFNLY